MCNKFDAIHKGAFDSKIHWLVDNTSEIERYDYKGKFPSYLPRKANSWKNV